MKSFLVAAALAVLAVVLRARKGARKQQLPVPANLSVLVKHVQIPARGIVCSKPSRVRLLKEWMFSEAECFDFDWGLQVYVGVVVGDVPMFLASVPMGDSGSYLAFRELYSHGAKYICRLGSSDWCVDSITEKDSHQVLLVAKADNLYGVMRDGGYAENELGREIYASSKLVQAMKINAQRSNVHVTLAVSHNTANYHATNFAQLEPLTRELMIKRRMQEFENQPEYEHTSDMESASLFLAAEESGKHAVTLLQRIRKTDVAVSAIVDNSKAHLRDIFLPLILNSLLTLE